MQGRFSYWVSRVNCVRHFYSTSKFRQDVIFVHNRLPWYDAIYTHTQGWDIHGMQSRIVTVCHQQRWFNHYANSPSRILQLFVNSPVCRIVIMCFLIFQQDSIPPRWPTRVFAVECVRKVTSACRQPGAPPAHFDLTTARNHVRSGLPGGWWLCRCLHLEKKWWPY